MLETTRCRCEYCERPPAMGRRVVSFRAVLDHAHVAHKRLRIIGESGFRLRRDNTRHGGRSARAVLHVSGHSERTSFTIQHIIHHPAHHSPSSTSFTIQHIIHHPAHHSPSSTSFIIQHIIHHPAHHSPSSTSFIIQHIIHHPAHHSPSSTSFTIQHIIHHPAHHSPSSTPFTIQHTLTTQQHTHD